MLTSRQQEVRDLRAQGMSARAIGERLGISRRTVRGHIAALEKHDDPAVAEAMGAFGLLQSPETVWFKNKQFSVQYRKPKEAAGGLTLDQVREAFTDLPAAPPLPGPAAEETMSDQMVVYPLFDVHHGLRAHAEISGEEMDLDRSRERLIAAMGQIIASAQPAERGVIINGGDFTHQTDDLNRTRRSGHLLDVAGRNGPTVRDAIELLSSVIEMALQKHLLVEYYSVPGNHDPQNWETIQIALAERYRDNPRVRIDERWNEFSVVEHGEVAIFIHHGDKRPPKDAVMAAAAEFPEVWGRSRYRLLMTGHLHHVKVDELAGCTWMQLPAVSVRDTHAATHLYKSHSMLMALGFDLEAESTRNTMRIKCTRRR